MKLSKLLAMTVALAACAMGTAAQAVTLRGGEQISNIAQATFLDPSKPAGRSDKITVTSNTVVITINKLPLFDIVYRDGNPEDGGTQNALATTKAQTSTRPGSSAVMPYVLQNLGNVDLTVNLSTLAQGGTATIYVDANKDGKINNNERRPATSLTITPEQEVELLVEFALPVNPGDLSGATPVGVAEPARNPQAELKQNLYEDGKKQGQDLQYFRVNPVLAQLDHRTPLHANNPLPGVTSTPDLPQGVNSGKVFAPPIDNRVDPNDPVPDRRDGYLDPRNFAGIVTKTPVHIINNTDQKAYPPADEESATADTVTFVDIISNTGNNDEVVTITPAVQGSIGSAAITKVFIDGQLQPDYDLRKEGYQAKIPAGKTISYLTQVTFPDDDNAATQRQPIVVVNAVVPVDQPSTRIPTVTNTVYPPAMRFGDATNALGGDPALSPVQSVDPVQAPISLPPRGLIDSPNYVDERAVFPMEIANTGSYPDSYTLSGEQALIGKIDYYDERGNLLPKNQKGEYVTPVLQPGQELKIFAVKDVEREIAIGTYTVTQKATSQYSNIVQEDLNDKIRVAGMSFIAGKFVQTTEARFAPEDTHGFRHIYTKNGAQVSSETKLINADMIAQIKRSNTAGAEIDYIGNPNGYTALSVKDSTSEGRRITMYTVNDIYGYKILAKNVTDRNQTLSIPDSLSQLNAALEREGYVERIQYVENSLECAVTLPSGAPGPRGVASYTPAGQEVRCEFAGNNQVPSGATVTMSFQVKVIGN